MRRIALLLDEGIMYLNEAKKMITESVSNDSWIERSIENDFVRLQNHDNFDPMLLQALAEMLESGELEQIPTSGQCRTAVSYRRPKVGTAICKGASVF
jgi:hypothetical protein